MGRSFPANFLWGTATAAHQVEGNNSNNDFWEWERDNKNIPDSDDACEQYKRYKKDFKLLKKLNNNAHRLSIEWSRIEPEEGKFSEKELKHYKDVLTELKKLNIEPLVTLHHFTNPIWFSEKGGWEKNKNVKYFERFAERCVKEYGSLVKKWVIINEPNVYVALGYLKGFFPPQKKNFLSTWMVYLNLSQAHKSVYKIIKALNPNTQVGSAIAMVFFKPSGLIERLLLPIVKFITNFSFLALTRNYHDFIGINHYFLYILNWREIFYMKRIKEKDYSKLIEREISDFGWLIYPQGIYEVVMETWRTYKLPIIITENGIADKKDKLRPNYIRNYLTWLKQSIKDGANVLGYFHWSLMDNIEWGQGKEIRFGLFETNYKTQERILRKSCEVYAEIAKTNGEKL